ncbi:carbon-nitrogen hydrolase family protein [Stenotrophomonas maltophilia]|uniref:carbon-nitrogen hydrolase family protein n=1 Tax=Stenotrophomonas maltophilia TaxID=40324 RepID=UPI00046AA3B6|nr:carbon-nitrogen hydrolase family protein [Stenotrophomonas maltophilia]OMP40791.1 carbon-nitrogen hydrolase [Stenotrophomonas sp. KAs 5-3]AIL06731.1 carbon-nitrogen hydrolase family protein [Stenotrophomonas maltophilia]OOD14421.1 carbon-nitrogen hydrolase [Stenotrophomonas maltophilia]QQA82300.1 carbon-nitrogen hydrolase family protein [Stenotrophomonas maltophilia]WQE23481.1 carbon-nitrogen hydrolase family protein [Stenotrophomonas maltophilia]
MKIVAAQMRSAPGDIDGNIERHVHFIERAASCGGAAVLFPEMSLTGYEPRLAEQLAMTADDVRLEVFQSLSDRHQILVAVGGPYRGNDRPEIGMFVFRSGQAPDVYTKQMLHADELPYFKAGTTSLSVTLGEEILVPAICFESLQMESALRAKDAGATVYVASVAKNMIGMERAHRHYATVARELGMIVLACNGVGHADGFEMTGGSAAWDNSGALRCSAGTGDEALVVYDLAEQSGSTVTLPAMGTLGSAG